MDNKGFKEKLLGSLFLVGWASACILAYYFEGKLVYLAISGIPIFLLVLEGFFNNMTDDSKERSIGIVQYIVSFLLLLFVGLFALSQNVSENTEVLKSQPISEGLVVNKVESEHTVPEVSYIVSGNGRTFVVEDIYVKGSKSVGQGVYKLEKVKVTATKKKSFW